jgi:hypothetical protein
MPQTDTQAGPQARPRTAPADLNASLPSTGVVWVRISPSQVMRTVSIALLTAAVVLGALLLLWQLRTFVSWLVAALFLTAILNPAVNWLQRRHRMIQRLLAVVLTYLGLVVTLLLMVGSSCLCWPTRSRV